MAAIGHHGPLLPVYLAEQECDWEICLFSVFEANYALFLIKI